MNKIHYSISEAAKELHVENHVLRYWEEELYLHIPRNNMGHRVYGPEELQLFRQIIQWKEEGLPLKEIQQKCGNRQIIQYPVDSTRLTASPVPAVSVEEDNKMEQFKQILGRIVSDAIRDNSQELTSDIAEDVTTRVNKELDYLFREKEEADEKRYRELDETIRSFQKARQEAAAAEISELKTKKHRRRSRKGRA
jgi:DNA-binding transcriptional MerR regulator